MSNQIITIKLNRFTSYLQQPQQQTQSPSTSPTDDLSTIILFQLQQWLNLIPGLSTASPPESREKSLNAAAAAAHWLLYIAASVLLLCFLRCCLPAISSCIIWIFDAIFTLIKEFFELVLIVIVEVFMLLFNIIKGFFLLLFNIVKLLFNIVEVLSRTLCNACKSVYRCFGYCCHLTGRADFESGDPAATYFEALRASSSNRPCLDNGIWRQREERERENSKNTSSLSEDEKMSQIEWLKYESHYLSLKRSKKYYYKSFLERCRS
ncbi:hypothetical protein vseg_001736 [Gypsophila vaccaria]